MDPALMREREAFKKRALANPVLESRKNKRADDDSPPKKKAKKESAPSKPREQPAKDPFAYKSMSGSSQHNFSVLAKIVKHMKTQHLAGDSEPRALEELLDETNQLDIGPRQRHWLDNEALKNNPKVDVTDDGKYLFKATFKLKDRKGLLRLLDKYDRESKGGIPLEDIQESLPNAEKAMKILGDSIITISRPMDKKKILFYNDKSVQLTVDEEFQKLWRSVAVDGIDEQKIEEYLQKQGISSMQDLGVKKNNVVKRKKASRKGKNFKKLNDHVADMLEDYSDKA
ncbi:General transcription factor IIE subunit 2 [Halotydeus destructor]|nr:General transcription factor IIE subunit 2 [Halotydeus destructor]